jgi:short subunit dehydrogenase-like uncharacterized protein
VDAEDPASLRRALRPEDVVLDAAGPFQERTTALVETAADVGFDVIDLADSARYVARVHALSPRVAAAGIRVLTACSSLSALSALLVRSTGASSPVRASAFLVPATRRTARPATARALLHSLGEPVLVRRAGRLVEVVGGSETRTARFPEPFGTVRGVLADGADAVTLPPVWPTLCDVGFHVEVRLPGARRALGLAARSEPLRTALRRALPLVVPIARAVGSTFGAFGVEVEDAGGEVRRAALVGDRSHAMAVIPAALAARDVLRGGGPPPGVVRPDRFADAGDLLAHLRAAGIALVGSV